MGITSDKPSGGRKNAARTTKSRSSGVTPTSRLAALTREWIDALEYDKQTLLTKVDRLQSEVDRLAPEVARLLESLARVRDTLDNAEANNVYATVLIGLGGFLVSYAAFTGNLAPVWANLSAGLLIAGIGLLLWQSVRRWRRG